MEFTSEFTEDVTKKSINVKDGNIFLYFEKKTQLVSAEIKNGKIAILPQTPSLSDLMGSRPAIFKAVSEGEKSFSAICIVGGKNGDVQDFCSPCGICRQVLSEFCKPDFKIILASSLTDFKVFTLSDLLPESFSL